MDKCGKTTLFSTISRGRDGGRTTERIIPEFRLESVMILALFHYLSITTTKYGEPFLYREAFYTRLGSSLVDMTDSCNIHGGSVFHSQYSRVGDNTSMPSDVKLNGLACCYPAQLLYFSLFASHIQLCWSCCCLCWCFCICVFLMCAHFS